MGFPVIIPELLKVRAMLKVRTVICMSLSQYEAFDDLCR